MNQQRRGFRPAVEAIEARELLSAGLVMPHSVAAHRRHEARAVVTAAGAFHGTYHSGFLFPNTGKTFGISGSGDAAGVGPVSATGQFQGIGSVAHGQAHGGLALVARGGSIFYHLAGPVQPGRSHGQGLPARFRYRITGGTGKYVGLRGTGTARLSLMPGSPPSARTFGQYGRFTLTLTPATRPG